MNTIKYIENLFDVEPIGTIYFLIVSILLLCGACYVGFATIRALTEYFGDRISKHKSI